MNLLKRYPITAFFVLAFVISWGIRIPMTLFSLDAAPLKLLAEFGPTSAALIVTAALNGRVGVRALLGRVLQWRANPWWYALVLLGPAALQVISIGAFVLLGGPGDQFQFPGLVLPILLTIGFMLSVGEEIGWRGFALRRLQSRTNPVVASLIIGVLWAIWHVPGDITNLGLLTAPSTYIAFLWFLGLTMTGSVLMAWVYNRTGGSLLLMALFHLGLTVLWQFVTLPQAVGQFGPSELSVVLMGIVAVMVVVFDARMRTTLRTTQKQISSVPPVEAQVSIR
jgi:CAAX protease family protein